MTLSQIAKKLGIENCPDLINEIFNDKSIDLLCEKIVDKSELLRLDKEFDIFGEYQKDVLCAVDILKNDKSVIMWLNAGVEYLNRVDDNAHASKKFPLPKSADEQSSVDIFPILLIASQLDKTKERYVSVGASDDEIKISLSAITSGFKTHSKRHGKPILPAQSYPWLCNYMCGKIFHIHGFNFEIRPFEFNGVYIKNKTTGKLCALILNETMHRDGYVLGTPGYLDDKDSFFASFEETPDAFVGFAVDEKGIVPNIKRSFSKCEWDMCMKKGDMIISFHIPSKADFSKENLDLAFEIGAKKMRQYFSQYDIKGIMCASWLVSPQLKDILKPDSKIVAFAERFTPLPQLNSGMSVFTNVFPAGITRYEDLPENSSLERGLKKLYLDGKYLYTYPGFFEI